MVKAKSADVVDNLCSRFEGALCDCSTVGIHRYWNLQDVRERFNYRNDAACFFFLADFVASGPRRFSADVENVGSLLLEFFTLIYCGLAIKKQTTIGKRIGSDVEDPHDRGAITEVKTCARKRP